MAWGRSNRYYCNNRRGDCLHALKDRAFSQAEFERFGGLCSTAVGGCDSALKEGEPLDLRPRRTAMVLGCVAVLTGGATAVRQWVFPPPLKGVVFAQLITDIDSSREIVEIEVMRTHGADHSLSVPYSTRDGSATAGIDFEAASGTLQFDAGEQKKRLSVRLVSDVTHRKPKRYFEVVLHNVEGTPLHRVEISPSAGTLTELVRLEQQVRTVSNLALDIGHLAYLLDETRIIIAAAQADTTPYGKLVLRDALAKADLHTENLIRAREAYGRGLRDLASQDTKSVLIACESVREQLVNQGHPEQAAASRWVSEHLQQLLQHGEITEMDRWVRELRRVIPDPPSSARTS